MAYLIKGAHVYNPDDLGVQDVLVINDKIAAVGKDLTVVLPELETVDASDKILTPGFMASIFTSPVAAEKAALAAVHLRLFSAN